jgi:hypothetical protein
MGPTIMAALRIVVGWICTLACSVALWKNAGWIVVGTFFVGWALNRFWPVNRTIVKSEEEQAGELIVGAVAVLVFLGAAFTGHNSLCWTILSCAFLYEIARDIWLMTHARADSHVEKV